MPTQKKYTIKGVITGQDNRPLQGLSVRAFDMDPNTAGNPLGSPVQTDAKGAYAISYMDRDFRPGGRESGGADVVVRVYDAAGKLLGESPLHKNAPQRVTINLKINGAAPASAPASFLFLLDKNKPLDLNALPPAEKTAARALFNSALAEHLLNAAGESRAVLEQALRGADIDFSYGAHLNLPDFFDAFILPEIRKMKLDEPAVEKIRAAIQAGPAGKVENLLGLGAAIGDNPAIGKAYRKAQALAFGEILGLAAGKIDKLSEKDIVWEDINEMSLRPLVEEGILTEKQKGEMLLLSDLSRLTGDNMPLIRALKKPSLKTIEDLVAMEQSDWLKLLTGHNIPLPAGAASPAAYAERISRNIEQSYPSAWFFSRMVHKNQGGTNPLLNALRRFLQNNPFVDLASTDFNGFYNRFNWEGIAAADRPGVKKQMLAYQRVHALTDRFEDSRILLSKGLDSAMAIARMPLDQFAHTSGLSYESSRLIYGRAMEKATLSAHFLEASRNAMFGTFNQLAVSNQGPVQEMLKTIDGFDDLFGSGHFCACAHCRSIYGPAAYFTDLMYFAGKHVSKRLFDPLRLAHPLYLKNRRPDLWQLPLTCANTTTEIPYLQVVNEVLEAYIRQAQGAEDVDLLLYEANTTTRLPAALPLEALRLFAGHFNTSLFKVYQTLRLPESAQWSEQLRLSEKEVSLIANPNPAEAHARFGNEPPAGMEVQRFLKYTRISRAELTDLLNATFADGISAVSVRMEKDPTDIQKYSEVLDGLDEQNLDTIHRYLRLWKKTNWSFREFDLLLNSLKSAGLLNALEEKDEAGTPKVLILAKWTLIGDALKCSPEELAALIFELPDISVKEGRKSLFERLFDTKKILETGLLPADKTQDKVTPLILAGLGISEAELGKLFGLLGIDTSVDQPVDKTLLSRLYRQVRIARGFKWNIENLAGALEIVLNGAPAVDAAHLLALVDFHRWLQTSPLKIPDLLFVLQGKDSSARSFRYNLASSAAAILSIQTAVGSDKKELLLQHLRQAFNLTEVQLTEEFLPHLVSTEINDPAITTALNATFTNGYADHPEDFAVLTALMREMERLSLFFERLEFAPEDISFFIQQPGIFGNNNLKTLRLSDIRAVVCYRSLLANAENAARIRECLVQYQSDGTFLDASLAALAGIWKAAPESLRSLLATFTFVPTALPAVRYLQELQELTATLGIEGQNLAKLGDTTFEGIAVARDIALGAFAAKYPDETDRAEKLEPYFDKINILRRDALCDFIIGQKMPLAFEDRAALYEFFLLDVEMSGCFRTSRLVAAITSLQLYVHRCLANLEQTDLNLSPGVEPVNVNPAWIPQTEWEWRKNYRVWEANRKVFLYPENWIDPALRDTKTPLFKELEDELLQENITQESAEAAYKKYLSQFSELAKLRYAGAYYYRKPSDFNFWDLGSKPAKSHFILKSFFPGKASEESVYYLFARTHTDPYQYYFRTYNPHKQIWSHWTKMELAIEADEISALMYNGRLYVFWTEVQRREINNITSEGAASGGSVFKIFTKYSFLDEKGAWSPPQRIYAGFIHASDDNVFKRVLKNGSVPSLPEEKNKRKDYVFEQFEKGVFRKPYARIAQNEGNSPLELSYIWSQEQGVPQVDYFAFNDSEFRFDLGSWGITIGISKTLFDITDNQFEHVVIEKKVNFKIEGYNTNPNPAKIDSTITLASPSHCIIHAKGKVSVYTGFNQISILSVDFNFSAPVYAKTYPSTIYTSHFSLSLSQNRLTNVSDDDIIKTPDEMDNPSSAFLKKEYELAYSGNGDFAHYIEDGSKGFTQVWRKIVQMKEGDGHLYLPGKGQSLQVEPLTTIRTDELTEILHNKGLKQFLSLQTQTLSNPLGLQFDMKGPYGEYYWELFFHIPFLIANHLNANQKYKEAKWWYERIFNPTAEETPSDQSPSDHNWQFREFRGLGVEKLKDILTDNAAIAAYENDPFDPHAIARLRTSAYQKAIVMKYIDNLLDWGDELFTQDTRESINEAFMLYRLAADLLGEKPVELGQCETADENALTYGALEGQIGVGSEFLIALENAALMIQHDYENNVKPVITSKHLATTLHNLNLVPPAASLKKIAANAAHTRLTDLFTPSDGGVSSPSPNIPPAKGANRDRIAKYADLVAMDDLWENTRVKWEDADTVNTEDLTPEPPPAEPAAEMINEGILAFCIPHNTDLLTYWDRVEDRMFKIRNCMNISGVRRSLALFQPPIDPGLLVRARAMGLSLEEVYNLATTPANIPLYRYEILIEKAKQFTQTVQSFGGALLSALENKDAEELTLLRSVQEQNILRLTREIRKNQIKEAQRQYQSMVEALVNVQNRIDYYQGLLEAPRNSWEIIQEISKHTANATTIAGATFMALSSGFDMGPQIVGFSFSTPLFSLSSSTQKQGLQLQDIASSLHGLSDSMGLEANFQRREQDWKFQLTLAEQEKKQLEQQLLAAEIRQNMAEKELEIHEKTIEQAKELYSFYKDKFTNLSLYNFLAGHLTRLYRQAYQMALEMAHKAERAYQFQREDGMSFLGNQYFESDRAGLLAGERLLLDLQRMEAAFIDNNIREFEMTKHISLKLLDPHALLLLKATGKCQLTLPEWLFDLETPGHYMRRIKNIGLSIPAIAGPYTSINCTMSMQESWVRKSDALTDGYGRTGMEDSRFGHYYGNLQSIVTSSAQNDGGLFEINFRDERYLPFEGLGVESVWMLELPSDLRQFDYNTITDVILHLRYTARAGGSELAGKATEYLKNSVLIDNGTLPYARLFSLKQDFPNAWYRFESGDENFRADMMKEQFGYLAQAFNLVIETDKIQLLGIKEKSLLALASEGVTLNSDQLNSHKRCSIEIEREAVDQAAEEVFLLVPYRFD